MSSNKSEDENNTKVGHKDSWEKAKIIGSFFTGIVIASATIFGSIFIPRELSEQSLESQKIIELSKLVPQLYDSTIALSPTVIAMASYGAPAVDFLLLALDNATEIKNESLVNTIISTMKYMDNESKKEIQSKLELEISQLNDAKVDPSNIKYIRHIIEILSSSKLDYESKRILSKYFSIISDFIANQYEFQQLNGLILKALADNKYPIHSLRLTNIDFENENLSGIDFSRSDLRGANFMYCDLIDCKFDGATLDSCFFYGARFFYGYEDSLIILNRFKTLANSFWENASLDDPIINLLKELNKEDREEIRLLELAQSVKENCDF